MERIRPVEREPYRGDLSALVADLHREACAETGLSDFGAPTYREGLERLVASLERLNDQSWAATRAEIVAALACRLRTEEAWKRNPGFREVSIVRPLVICGHPRTGTTALHKLLSIDPQFQGLEHWLCESPMPRPPREQWESYPAFCKARALLEERHRIAPGMQIAHEVVVDELDECLEVLRQEFVTNRNCSTFHIPDYDKWLREQDEKASYLRLADVMRLIGMNSPRKWLLKNPGHIANMGTLLEVFPDAQVIVTSRDMIAATGSLCSVLTASHSRFDTDFDPSWWGRREIAYWSEALKDAARVEAQSEEKFLHLDHSEFHRDPIAAVRRIYERFGLELTDVTETDVRRWLAANPAGKRGRHGYRLEDYGITCEDVIAAYELKENRVCR